MSYTLADEVAPYVPARAGNGIGMSPPSSYSLADEVAEYAKDCHAGAAPAAGSKPPSARTSANGVA